MRPALLLLAARACGYEGSKAPAYGAVTEFIHTATLVHDDIVDEAVMRRGQQSVNALLGNDFTVLLGDFLYIRSIGLAIEMGSLEILEVITEITLRMIEGMILELTRGGAVDLTEEEHLDILKRKTAYLFFGCAQMGAKLGERPRGGRGGSRRVRDEHRHGVSGRGRSCSTSPPTKRPWESPCSRI